MKLSERKIKAFQSKIFSWWTINKRDLPWRHTHDPYKILVSEVMLQQTQVLRVIPKYTEFIKTFPTIESLAQVSPSAVIRLWKGMGYNRRALYLHQTAKVICSQYDGRFPINHEILTKLPGLGTYTARAVLVFAYKRQVPLIDTNIRQIINHFFLTDQAQACLLASIRRSESARQGRALEREVEIIARQLIPKGKSWEWHQALMDYGALELPKLKVRKVRKVIKSKPFRESNRFYRGKIIDLLREQEVTETKLIDLLIDQYQKPEAFFDTIIASLLSDGLIEWVKRKTLRLPEG